MPPPARRAPHYRLALSHADGRWLPRAWLMLGLAALVLSGVFSILLVASRTPYLNQWLPGTNFFRVALVLHVDLSVLVWFIAMAGLLWSLYATARFRTLAWLGLGASAVGMLLMSAAPFLDSGTAIMANYVPILDSRLFLNGLVVFGLGAVLLVLRSLLAAPAVGLRYDGDGALSFGLHASVVAAAVALVSFAWSWLVLPAGLDDALYYELLFWGGGHALQFVWTLLMLVSWLWLSSTCGARLALTPRITILLFLLALLGVFVNPWAYLAYPVTSVEHRHLLTWAMRLGGGPAILPLALAVLQGLFFARLREPAHHPLRAALLASVLLFSAGGLIGVFIQGSNVRIPAHYHGCIVGVTLALMGVAYRVLPIMGYQAPRGRLANSQPWVYGLGQLIHIIGLVWSGGYGVQRKVAGSEQVLDGLAQTLGMGMMGLGGLISIVGGFLFLVVMVRALRHPLASPRPAAEESA